MADTKETYRTVTPYLVVPDANSMIAFLKKAFGATEVQIHRNDDGTVGHAELQIGDSLVMMGQAAGQQHKAREAAFYLWVDDVDETYRRALDAGATSESAPEDKPYGHRNAGVVDRNGNTWWIGAPVKSRG
jgi:PhnB protein